ncbi:MAG: glycosyltransferase family 2 protein [Eubacteriales bacterium]
MKLSIIVPHYNSPMTLQQLLETIPVRDEVEIIVVDDNSRKERAEYNQLMNTYSNVIFLENTSGVKGAGSSRNIGLDHATGDWLLFADADDYFVEGFWEIVEKYIDSDTDVIYFRPTSVHKNSGTLATRHLSYEKYVVDYYNDPQEINERLLRYQFMVPWSKMIRHTLVQIHHIRFDEVIASNDVMFSTKVGFYARKISSSTEVIYCVVDSDESLTKTFTKEIHDARTNVIIEYYLFLKERLSKEEYRTLSRSVKFVLTNCIRHKLGCKQFVKSYIKLKKNKLI